MIIEAIFNALFLVIDAIISLIPNIGGLNFTGGMGALSTLLAYALYFFPIDLWVALIGNIALWLGIQSGWFVVEWTYKKIPGVS